MSDLVNINLLVERYVADEVTANGLAEIALRRVNARFREFVKCEIVSKGNSGEQVNNELLSRIAELTRSNNADRKSIRSSLRSIKRFSEQTNEKIDSISRTTKDLSIKVDSLFHSSNAVKNISYLSTGIALANMAVDIVGFAYIGQQLNELNGTIQTIVSSSHNAENMLKNDKVSECQKLSRRYTHITNKVKDNEDVSIDDLETLLWEIEGFLTAIINNFCEHSLDAELTFHLIFTMLPAYTTLMAEWVKRYYLSKQKQPDNLENFLTLYDRLLGETYTNCVQDYYLRLCHNKWLIFDEK